MSSGYLTSPLVLVINALFDLYILLVLLRFLFQLLRADFYNPVSQFIVKLTTHPLRALRRVCSQRWRTGYRGNRIMLDPDLRKISAAAFTVGPGQFKSAG